MAEAGEADVVYSANTNRSGGFRLPLPLFRNALRREGACGVNCQPSELPGAASQLVLDVFYGVRISIIRTPPLLTHGRLTRNSSVVEPSTVLPCKRLPLNRKRLIAKEISLDTAIQYANVT